MTVPAGGGSGCGGRLARPAFRRPRSGEKSIQHPARRRSIHRLRWRDVDLSRGAILVPPELMKAGREHEVPIHPALDRVLREALRSRGKVDPEGLVIGCEVGKTVVALHSACRRAGLEPIGWHTLRHSFGSWLDQVASFAELRALLGHAPGNIVSARYAHPQWEQLVAVIGRLPDLIGDRGASASQKA